MIRFRRLSRLWCALALSLCSVLTAAFLISPSATALSQHQAVTAVSPLSLATLHTYHEQPGQTTFRSKQSLRDRSDRSWQVILFKRYQGLELQGLYLRLVGFPGLASLVPQQPITITTGASLQWQAAAALDPQTPQLPDNAGQYDLTAVMAQLTSNIPLQIELPLKGNSLAKIVVPPFAVREWRQLAAQSPEDRG